MLATTKHFPPSSTNGTASWLAFLNFVSKSAISPEISSLIILATNFCSCSLAVDFAFARSTGFHAEPTNLAITNSTTLDAHDWFRFLFLWSFQNLYCLAYCKHPNFSRIAMEYLLERNFFGDIVSFASFFAIHAASIALHRHPTFCLVLDCTYSNSLHTRIAILNWTFQHSQNFTSIKFSEHFTIFDVHGVSQCNCRDNGVRTAAW